MTLTASIVVHDTRLDLLEKTIDSVLRGNPTKLYLIDNGDGRSGCLAGKHPCIEFRHVGNRGFGAAHNIAMRDAVGEFPGGCHLVVNPDVEWSGDVLGKLKAFMEMRPDVGIAAPEVLLPDGTPQWNARMLPTPFDLIARRVIPRFLVGTRLDRYEMRQFRGVEELDAPYLLGCFMLFRNEAIADCGCFDERFFMYPEDIDLTRRIHSRWRTVRWNGVSVVHAHAAASRKNLKMLRVHVSNMVRYFRKWGCSASVGSDGRNRASFF